MRDKKERIKKNKKNTFERRGSVPSAREPLPRYNMNHQKPTETHKKEGKLWNKKTSPLRAPRAVLPPVPSGNSTKLGTGNWQRHVSLPPRLDRRAKKDKTGQDKRTQQVRALAEPLLVPVPVPVPVLGCSAVQRSAVTPTCKPRKRACNRDQSCPDRLAQSPSHVCPAPRL